MVRASEHNASSTAPHSGLGSSSEHRGRKQIDTIRRMPEEKTTHEVVHTGQLAPATAEEHDTPQSATSSVQEPHTAQHKTCSKLAGRPARAVVEAGDDRGGSRRQCRSTTSTSAGRKCDNKRIRQAAEECCCRKCDSARLLAEVSVKSRLLAEVSVLTHHFSRFSAHFFRSFCEIEASQRLTFEVSFCISRKRLLADPKNH